MPDFTVIEGGGGGDGPKRPEDNPVRAQEARDAFERLMMEMLRATARGDDRETRVGRALRDFVNASQETSANVFDLIDETLAQVYEHRLKPMWDGKDRERESKALFLLIKMLAQTPKYSLALRYDVRSS